MDLRNAIQKRAAEVTKPRWKGEMGSPPRGYGHLIVGYESGRARAACGTLFRLHDNTYFMREDSLDHPQMCPRCRAKIESGAVEDAR